MKMQLPARHSDMVHPARQQHSGASRQVMAAPSIKPHAARRRTGLTIKAHATAVQERPQVKKPRKIPRSIHEVERSILGFSADLAEDHPGFHDKDYKARRLMISNLALDHQIGEPIPRVTYTPEEVKVWATVLQKLRARHPNLACKEYLKAQSLVNFSEDKVPQLQDMSNVLMDATGWSIRPVAGLMHPREFLAGFAFKTFHSTQFIRHHSNPSYTPEPDLCHELIGHVPMLCDPKYADLVHQIGLASLEADDKMVWHLTKVYWYTVEFGAVWEKGRPKAFGAGILSSYGELEHMASRPLESFRPFDPFAHQPKMNYMGGYQDYYYALESFEDASEKLRALAAHIKLPEELRGNPVSA